MNKIKPLKEITKQIKSFFGHMVQYVIFNVTIPLERYACKRHASK